jgi:deazaflavin-dependent oxidoreductase (nitroreductase family)
MTRVTIRERFLWVLKTTLNRVTAPIARSGHGPFSLIRHVGRKSGRTYETPVILGKVPEGFIAELTYGDSVDWVRNIRSADGCVVVHRGKEYRVDHVEPCSAEKGLSGYGTPFRQVLKAAGRDKFLLLRTDNTQTADQPVRRA